jgi:hypothetical protein
MCCRQMGCKRSGVRISLAPLVRSEIRTSRTVSTAAKYRNGRPRGPPYVCSDRAFSFDRGCWQDTGFHALNRAWSACHLGKSRPRRSGDSCHLLTTPVRLKGCVCGNCCRLCKWPSRAGRPCGPVDSLEPRLPARTARFADRGPGAWARRAAPMVPGAALGPLVRCTAQAPGCPLARPLCACRRTAAPHEGCGPAHGTPGAGRRPASRLTRALTPLMPDPRRRR